ncbi:SPOR domain-containing protein [Trichloromonas sp.]|uniref:SPOR domain-containing protein n=1 Tax=Trichloromonas sp. TaxID=3069249 RepID=UPI002A496B7C|nr:SPOR domain-containing protein [Trichloromonas sp.]
MVMQVQSRSQRRMEKKHAIMLVVLLLVISLISFFLGIMVGRSSSGAPSVSVESATPPLPVPPPLAESPPAPETGVPAAPTVVPAVEEEPEKPTLTFYEALPKGESPPLGSGINLPPPGKTVKTDAPTAKAEPHRPLPPVLAAPEAEKVDVATPAPTVKAEAPPTPLPKPVVQGTFVVQVASFKSLGDANALRDRLGKKGYGAYVQEANLGDKGVWQRVMVGPYAGNEAVTQVVERLKNEERLSGMIKKQ